MQGARKGGGAQGSGKGDLAGVPLWRLIQGTALRLEHVESGPASSTLSPCVLGSSAMPSAGKSVEGKGATWLTPCQAATGGSRDPGSGPKFHLPRGVSG